VNSPGGSTPGIWGADGPGPGYLPKPIFPPISASGDFGAVASYDLRNFVQTADCLVVVCTDRRYQIIACGHPPAVLLDCEDRDTVNWVDFTFELVVGIIGLALGVTIGRRGYKALKPLVTRLWTYPDVQERVRAIGHHILRGDALATGLAIAELWGYLWANHRPDLLAGIWSAVRQELTFGALIIALMRWTARLMSGGVTFLIELGVTVRPLGGKLLR